MSLGLHHRAGVHITFWREVKAGKSVLVSRARAFDMTLKRGFEACSSLQAHAWGGRTSDTFLLGHVLSEFSNISYFREARY